jgi:hypothetical protein
MGEKAWRRGAARLRGVWETGSGKRALDGFNPVTGHDAVVAGDPPMAGYMPDRRPQPPLTKMLSPVM